VTIAAAINGAVLKGWTWLVHLRDEETTVALLLYRQDDRDELWCMGPAGWQRWVPSSEQLASNGWEPVAGP
jgi:hypothetical protein